MRGVAEAEREGGYARARGSSPGRNLGDHADGGRLGDSRFIQVRWGESGIRSRTVREDEVR